MNSLSKINYVDVGARGDLGPPWSDHESELVVYGFEADPQECQRLSEVYPHRNYYPSALFSSIRTIDLHITNDPFQSSIYPPSINNQFEESNWENRFTREVKKIDCSTLDTILGGYPIDAIKIDTQGAEYEILQGGLKLLTEAIPFLFLETWTHPVYQGAPLAGDILSLLTPLGFELWAVEPAALWRYQLPDKCLPTAGIRKRLIGLNLMLLPSLDKIKQLDRYRIYARIKILRWYGFLDAAYILADSLGDHELLQSLKDQIKRESSTPFLLRRRLTRYPLIT